MRVTPAKFWDRHAPRYAASPIKDIAAYEYTLGRTQSYLTPRDLVLELGCGTGSTALYLAPYVAQITGTDVSPAMIKIAKDKAAEAGKDNAIFQVAEAGALPPGPTDAVLAFNLFHLVPDAETVMDTVYNSLAPGGFFISKTPCLADRSLGLKRFGFKMLIPLMRLVGLAPAVRMFTFSELERCVRAAGFDIVESGSFPAMSRYLVAQKPSTDG